MIDIGHSSQLGAARNPKQIALKRFCFSVLLLGGLSFQLGCSPGGVVAGTIGAAGAVAGAAVDVVLRDDVQHGLIE